jgi:transposase
VDIGKFFHVACILQETQGKYRYTPHIKFLSKRSGYKKFEAYLVGHGVTKENSIIGLEATGHYWFTLVQKLRMDGFKVVVCNPLQIQSYRNNKIRRIKTDDSDCELIAKVIKIGDNSIPMEQPDNDLFVLKQISRFRWDLTRNLSSLKLQTLSVLETIFPEYQEVFADVFGKTSVEILLDTPTPMEIAALDVEKLTKQLEKTSRKQFGRAVAEKLKKEAVNTFGLTLGIEAFSVQITFLMTQVKQLQGQIQHLEKEMKKLVEQKETKLMTIPGISYVIAGTILGETVDFRKKNEKDYRSLLAYAGLDVAIKQSGMYQGKSKMSKRGNPYLRFALMQASLVAAHNDAGFKKIYEKQRSQGKHYKVALSHVADKLTAVVHTVMRTGNAYIPLEEYQKQQKEKSRTKNAQDKNITTNMQRAAKQ